MHDTMNWIWSIGCMAKHKEKHMKHNGTEALGGSTALARETPENANILHWLKVF